MGTKYPKWLLDLAKQMDTPEMRDLYRRQKVINPDLDKDCDEAAEEIQDIFNHMGTPKDGKK